MQNESNGVFSVFKIILIIVMSIIIILSLAVNIIFLNTDKEINFFGKTLFLLQTNEMEPVISKDTLVVADKVSEEELNEGSVVLCNYHVEEMQITRLSRIQSTEIVGDEFFYEVKGDAEDLSALTKISFNDVIAKGSVESSELGWIITNVKSIWGIVFTLIIPSVVIIILVIISAIVSKKSTKSLSTYSDFDIPLVTEKKPKKRKKVKSPLFEPDENINMNDDFIAKKKSIAENFSQKKVTNKPSYNNVVKAERDAKKEVLFDVSDKKNASIAKQKASERAKFVEKESANGDFSAYKKQNSKAMDLYEKKNWTKDTGIKFVSKVSENSSSMPKSKGDVDQKAAEIKLALQKRTMDDSVDFKPKQKDIPKNNIKLQSKEQRNIEKKSNQKLRTTTTKSKMDEVKNRYINKPQKRITGSATFDDLMKVIDNEKQKLK